MPRKLLGVVSDTQYVAKDLLSGNKVEFDYVYDEENDYFKRGKTYMRIR